MEDYNEQKSNINIINEEPKQMSFSEYFYNDIDLIPILKESLKKMKEFITYIINQLKRINKNNEYKQVMFLTEKIFKLMLNNSEKLGIPFFYQLVNQEEFKNILTNFFWDNICVEQIKELLEKIIFIFNIDYKYREIDNPLYPFYYDFINCGIIEKNDIKEDEIRESLTEEEMVFVEAISLNPIAMKHKSNEYENASAKDSKIFIEKLITECEDHLTKLMGEEKICNSSFEFYKEIINEMKKEKNNYNQEDPNQTNLKEDKDNKKNQNINLDERDEEEEEIMTKEQIKNDIKELRKKPLKERTYFYKDELIKEDEDEYIEYKNYYFPFNYEKERELERQFCAFLNADGGRIYLGIDDQKIIDGVPIKFKVSYYESKILKLVNAFRPKIEPKDYFKIYAIPIKNNKNGKIINNLYIFKIVIKQGDPTELYYVHGQGLNIAIRQAGQCANLKASEIYEEIIKRKNMKKLQKNQIINDNSVVDFDDPEPLINKKIKKIENLKDNWGYPQFKPTNKKYNNKNNNINNNHYNKKNNNDNNKINDYNKNDIHNKNNNKTNNYNNKNNSYNKNNNNYNNNNNEFDNSEIGFKKNKNKKNKKKGNNKNKLTRVQIFNIDKDVNEQNMIELFKSFNAKEYKFYPDQNGTKNGYIDFDNEDDADNFVETFDGNTFGNKRLSLKKVFV